MYGGTAHAIRSKGDPVLCYKSESDITPCSYDEYLAYYNKYVDEPLQQEVLDEIIKSVKEKTTNVDDQARIIISMVQHIPYNKVIASHSYPYEVLYYNSGVCEGKSLLATSLLSKLGYSTEVMIFNKENHMTMGILTDKIYSYNGKYAFVEMTSPSIITDDESEYEDNVYLTSLPSEYKISDGIAMTTLYEEYEDAKRLNEIRSLPNSLPSSIYNEWINLISKYDIEVNWQSSPDYLASDYLPSNCVISQNGVCISS
jgi:hypothetical protein